MAVHKVSAVEFTLDGYCVYEVLVAGYSLEIYPLVGEGVFAEETSTTLMSQIRGTVSFLRNHYVCHQDPNARSAALGTSACCSDGAGNGMLLRRRRRSRSTTRSMPTWFGSVVPWIDGVLAALCWCPNEICVVLLTLSAMEHSLVMVLSCAAGNASSRS